MQNARSEISQNTAMNGTNSAEVLHGIPQCRVENNPSNYQQKQMSANQSLNNDGMNRNGNNRMKEQTGHTQNQVYASPCVATKKTAADYSASPLLSGPPRVSDRIAYKVIPTNITNLFFMIILIFDKFICFSLRFLRFQHHTPLKCLIIRYSI
jgi:hypothetical protein